MDVRELIATLGLAADPGINAEDWAVAQAARPTGALPFVSSDFVHDAAAYCHLPEPMTAAALAMAERIAATPALAAMAWYGRWLMHERKGDAAFWRLPYQALDSDAGKFNLVVLIAGAPDARAYHHAHAIPAKIVADAMDDFRLCGERYHKLHGRWGVGGLYTTGWLQLHIRGDIYRLGRLQFVPGKTTLPVTLFRHRENRSVVALADAGQVFRRDGYAEGAGGVSDAEGAWTSRFEENEREIIGNPIEPARGRALPRAVHLPRGEWDRVLSPGDPVLQMHIPAGSRLLPEACAASVQQTLTFYPRHFPEIEFKAIACNSWLFDAQFEEALGEESNIVAFLREFYLVTTPGERWSGIRFVFNRIEGRYGGSELSADSTPEEVGLKDLPRDTTLQRTLIEHIEQGGHWRRGGALLLVDDIPNYGRQTYRNQPHPW